MNAKVKGINLLPREYIVAEKVRFYQKIAGVALAIETVCFIAFVAIPPKNEVVATRQELEQKQSELASSRYAGVNKTLNDLEEAKAEMLTWTTQYNTIKQKGYISGSLLDELIARVPEGVSISNLTVTSAEPGEDSSSEKTIKIEGYSKTGAQGLSYVTVLETLYPAEGITHEVSYDEKTDLYMLTINISVSQTSGISSEETAQAEKDVESEEVATTEGEG